MDVICSVWLVREDMEEGKMDESIFLLGGAPWINLCNTMANLDKKSTDFLDYPHVVKRWLVVNNLLSDDKKLEAEEWETMSRTLHELRMLSRKAMLDIKEMGALSHSFVGSLQKLLAGVSVRAKLVEREDKCEIQVEGTTLMDHVTFLIIQSIMDTVYSISPKRIRKCEYENCILSFVDTSKSGRRRWCSMDICGNRKYTRNHYNKE